MCVMSSSSEAANKQEPQNLKQKKNTAAAFPVHPNETQTDMWKCQDQKQNTYKNV